MRTMCGARWMKVATLLVTPRPGVNLQKIGEGIMAYPSLGLTVQPRALLV